MKKNILIVDDSALMRRLLSDIINSDSRFIVSKVAFNGLEALDYVTMNYQNIDCVVLDINMPKMNGIQFMEQITKLNLKLKVIIVSTIAKEGAKETIKALELGAFDFITKPESFIEAKGDTFKSRLLNCLSVATERKMFTSSNKTLSRTRSSLRSDGEQDTVQVNIRKSDSTIIMKKQKKTLGKDATKLVVLACSTGGPKALQQVIPLLPKNLDASFLLVQHMPEGFTNSLAVRLDEMSKMTVKEASDGDVLKKGYIYIAKGGYQMRVNKVRGEYHISITNEAARNGLKPCADVLFESLIDSDFDEITCVVLTGMGGDGTQGIKKLNDNNTIYVIAQDEETCTVYGMPKVIAESGLVNEVQPIQNIAEAITNHVGVLEDGR